jgi:hypothetical protein
LQSSGDRALSKEIRIGAAVIVLIPCLVLGVWVAAHPDSSDPKNIQYVMWKQGLFQMNEDLALGTMVGDYSSRSLVIGKSEQDLKKRFGYLRTIKEIPYYNRCYSDSPWNGKPVKLLRSSNWMVVFDGGKAIDLILLKGC